MSAFAWSWTVPPGSRGSLSAFSPAVSISTFHFGLSSITGVWKSTMSSPALNSTMKCLSTIGSPR